MENQELERYLRGDSLEGYRVFGAHASREYGQEGVRFTVYAPNAVGMELIGSFNGWQGWKMERRKDGVWSLFARDIRPGALYKYRVLTSGGETHDRMDPFAFSSEVRPNTASVVCEPEGFPWTDGEWMRTRSRNYNGPMSVYEMHAGSWKRREDGSFYTYRELADELVPYLKKLHYTHVELMPLTEYPFDGSWGYQAAGYFSATSRYGDPQGLMELVNRCHGAGIGVLLDFVPLHFVKDFYALHQFDGGFLYESEFRELRESEWGTALFDFSKPHVQSFLKSSLDFWLSCYHFDGIRYDAVSRMLYRDGMPEKGVNEPASWFLRSANFALSEKYPTAMLIAEDSSQCLKVTAPVVYGGMGFHYKWDLGWMHDTLNFLATPPGERAGKRELLLHSLDYFYQDIYLLPFSHDEVVHGKKTIADKIFGTYEEKFPQLRTLYLLMYTHPGKKLNFMGNELAELKEWDEEKALGWNLLSYPIHDGFFRYFNELQELYLRESALFREDYNPASFRWLCRGDNPPAVFAYLRDDLQGETVYAALNFSWLSQQRFLLPVGGPGRYETLLSTDEERFGGKGRGARETDAVPLRGGWAVPLELPAFCGCVLKQKK